MDESLDKTRLIEMLRSKNTELIRLVDIQKEELKKYEEQFETYRKTLSLQKELDEKISQLMSSYETTIAALEQMNSDQERHIAKLNARITELEL